MLTIPLSFLRFWQIQRTVTSNSPERQCHSVFAGDSHRVPLLWFDQVVAKLRHIETLEIIRKVNEPTDWCAGMVVIPKANGSIRICCDFTHQNNSILHEQHVLPSIAHILGGIQDGQVLSKLNANSRFRQIPLEESSQLLTTLIMPQERYCYGHLPFGICSALEYFQKRMTEVLSGQQGTICLMNDIPVFAARLWPSLALSETLILNFICSSFPT